MALWGRQTSAINWNEVLQNGMERFAKLVCFERQLFLDLGECYHPSWSGGRGRRLRILGRDEPELHVDGLLDTVQRELEELRWCLPLWEQNAELYKIGLENARKQRKVMDAVMIHNLVIPREIREWIDATTDEEPEAASTTR